MKKLCISLCAAAMFAGCTTMISTVKPKDPADPVKGYVYGQFYQNNKIQTSMRLVVKNVETGKTDTIYMNLKQFFSEPEHYGVHAMLPGKYQIVSLSISYSETQGQKKLSLDTEKPFTHPVMSQPFEVKAGEKVYIGDFIASSEKVGNAISWSLNTAYTYADTTKEINVKYPNIASLPSREVFVLNKTK